MTKALYFIFASILLLTGVGLFSLTNQGILSFTEPYARSLPEKLKPQNLIVALAVGLIWRKRRISRKTSL